MSDTNPKVHSVAPSLAMLVPAAVLSAVAALAVVVCQQASIPLSTIQFIAGLVGIVVCTILVLGPSRIILTLVFLLALLDHQFRSPFIIPLEVTPQLAMLVPYSLLIAIVSLAVVVWRQACVRMPAWEFIAGLAGLVALTICVVGPTRIVLTLVILLDLLDHQFHSPLILSFTEVEWHPRELLLLLLFMHAAVKLVQYRLWIRWTPLHVSMLLYTAVFAYAAWRGLWLGNDPRAIIAECRAPLFLGAFWVFAAAVRTPRDLYYYGYLTLCVVAVLATATVVAFAYFTVAGPMPNTQNALGEFVPRLVSGIPLQSIRPSGHACFEAALVVFLGMLLCPREPWYRKAVYALLAVLLAAAIGAGMMRTALVSVSVSLAVMLWLNLPRMGKALMMSLALLMAGALVFAGLFQPTLSGAVPFRDYSLNARAVETAGALEAIRAQPLLGSGFGSSFVALDLAQEASAASAVPALHSSLHNAWLYIAWKAGLAGLGLAVLALAGMLLYSQQVVSRLPSMNQRCLGRALQAALIGQLVASAAMPRLTYANGALFLGTWVMAMVLLEWGAEGEKEAPIIGH